MFHFSHLSRVRAVTLHIAVSLAVVSCVSLIVMLKWYPGALMESDGDWRGVLILALVDVVLGPFLTAIVYKPRKPGLMFDMSVIVAVQVFALVYGLSTLHSQRPALLVYADDQLQSIPLSVAVEFLPAAEVARYQSEGLPVKKLVNMPRDALARADFIRTRMKQHRSLHRSYGDYVSFNGNWQKILADSLDIVYYTRNMPTWQDMVSRAAHRLGRSSEELAYLPLVGTRESVIVIADAMSGEFLDHLSIPYDSALRRPRKPLLN